MQDYVTLETALKLKEAGFPQPIQLGQFQLCYDLRFVDPPLYCEDSKNGYIFEDHDAFAPRVTDILPYLPNAIFWLCETSGAFVVDCPVGKAREMEYHINPAEAAAQMWLKRNKK